MRTAPHPTAGDGCLSQLVDRLLVERDLLFDPVADRRVDDPEVLDDLGGADVEALKLVAAAHRVDLLRRALGEDEAVEIAAVRIEERHLEALDRPRLLLSAPEREGLAEDLEPLLLPASNRGTPTCEQGCVSHFQPPVIAWRVKPTLRRTPRPVKADRLGWEAM